MTDVAGPPLPPVRFSSLPIRGADAARTDGADESDLEFNCSMAQAFEIPTGNRKTAKRRSPAGAILRVPRRAFQIAAPGRPDPAAGSIDWQYGSSFGSPQARANFWSDATRGGPIPGSAICRRLINPVEFDKAKLPADERL